MKKDIKVPAMGESITEAVIGSFLKASNSVVKAEEEIIELETEKVNQVLYAPISGTLTWTVSEGDSVKIGAILGSIESETGGVSKVEEKKEKEPEKTPESPVPPEAGQGERVMQQEFVATLKEEPSPPAAAKTEASIKEKPQPTEKSTRENRRRMTKIRQTIGRRLVDALHNAAMLTTFNEVDMSAILDLRAKYKESFVEKHGVKLGFMSFFVKAVSEGLKSYPDFNSYIDGEEIVERNYYDIGIAVGTDRGLIVPVVRGCDALSFAEIERQIVTYAKKARENRITIEDLAGGGFTITNGGVYGSLLSTPILNPPQVGILGMHKITKRAVVINDEIVIRPMMYLALSYDHRIVDGKEAVTFLVHIKEILEEPSRLLLLGSDEKI